MIPFRRLQTRFIALALLLTLGTPALAQPPAGEVVVTASAEARSDWKRAETRHLVVLSQGSEKELSRVTGRLEQLHQLMSRIYRPGDLTDPTLKLRVVLLDAGRFAALPAQPGSRRGEGPYAKGFAPGYRYHPRIDGEVLTVARTDQTIDLNTPRRFTEDCDSLLSDGGDVSCNRSVPHYPPLTRPWEATLYSAFARRFLLTYLPAAYPRWYVDGVGALFSTIAARRDEAIDYARVPAGFFDIIRSYGEVSADAVLTEAYLNGGTAPAAWTPYHAWLLAHFFLFADAGVKWSGPFRSYMEAIQQGTPPAQAAAAFGNMCALSQAVARHARQPTSYARTAAMPIPPDQAPLVTILSAREAAFVEARIALDERLPEAGLAAVHGLAIRQPENADGLALVAEAGCRSGHPDECLATAEQALARSPDHVAALTWKGVALADRALGGDREARATGLAASRAALEKAIARDEGAPLAALAYFQSFVRAGEPVPERAMAGMARAIRAVPAAPAPRIQLARELVRTGQPAVARRLLLPLATDLAEPGDRAD